jgi:putative transposase
MKFGPLHFLIFPGAGWLQRRGDAQVAYLVAENAVYKEHFAGERLRLTDGQRRRLAVKAEAVGRAGQGQFATIATPDTILRWYRKLVAQKYDGSRHRRRGARAPVSTATLIVRTTNDNPRWG